MNDKKHIDRLFQEGFKNFEAIPDDSVWKNIEESLGNKPKNRRVIPLWWKLAGIAAGLLLLFTIGNTLFNKNNQNPSNKILVDSEKDSANDNKVENNLNNLSKDYNIGTIVNSDGFDDIDSTLAKEGLKNNTVVNKTTDSKNALNNGLVTSQNLKTNSSMASTNKKTPNLKSPKFETQEKTVVYSESNLLNNTNKTVSKKEQSSSNGNLVNEDTSTKLLKNSTKSNKEAIVNNIKVDNTGIDTSEKSIDETIIIEEKLTEDNKPSIEEALTLNEDEEKTLDNDLKPERKWNIMPNIAPVYFNTLGKGSSIDGQFNNNDKSGTVNMSLGIAASYAISNKLSVRTGVNKVNVGYNTNDVLIYESVEPVDPETRPIKNINYTSNTQNITIISTENFAFSQVPSVVNNVIDASLDQRLGFIELPLELAYKISDKKLGVSIIGGMSTLFLNENEIYSTLNGNSTLLGEANNVKDISFSANLGLGLDYKLSDKFNINLEPVFKYQMNTFENTSGDFKPYILGVYTGFSFKF